VSERKRIEERLRKKEQEIKSFEEKIKDTKVYCQALRDILRMMEKAEEAETSPETTLRAGSMVAQARAILLEHGTPVHIDDLLDALGKGVTRETKASLTGSLAAYVRRHEIFTRPAPSTFGLIELGHATTEGGEPEPPPGFGKVTTALHDDISF